MYRFPVPAIVLKLFIAVVLYYTVKAVGIKLGYEDTGIVLGAALGTIALLHLSWAERQSSK